MTKEELFRAVGEVREDQIAEAEHMKQEPRPWRRRGALAACLAVVLAGALALEYLDRGRKWGEIRGNFQTADVVESAPAGEDGGALDNSAAAGGLDGVDYQTGSTARPAPHSSVNVEIGELADTGAEKDPKLDEDQPAVSSSACLVWLPPEEIFAQDTAIFRGTVRALRYYVVEGGGWEMEYTVASVEVTDPIRGDLEAGETRTILYPGGPHVSTSLSGPLEDLVVGSDAVFMPMAATLETGRQEGESWFCYADLANFYLYEGMRFVFLDTGDGLAFDRSVYGDMADAETLEDVTAYIREMTGVPERVQQAAIPTEPQADPADTVEADPAAEPGPNGARELPGGAYVGEP